MSRLGVELGEGTARAAVLEAGSQGFHLRWYATFGFDDEEELASEIRESLAGAGLDPDSMAVALPPVPGTMYRPLQLPPLKGEELVQVAEGELRREVGQEDLRGLTVRAWQYGGESGEGVETLAVGVPGPVVEGASRLVRSLGIDALVVSPPVSALHHGLLAAGDLDEEGLTGLAYLGDRYGFVAYVRGKEWILAHQFPTGDADVDALLRELRQSFVFLRSRAPGAEVTDLVLCGPALPRGDFPASVEDAVTAAQIREYVFPEALKTEGIAHAGDFLRLQSRYVLPLTLAAHGEAVRLDFLPPSAHLPRIRRRLVRRAVTAGAAGLLLAAAHAGVLWWQGERARGELASAQARLADLRPRVERLEGEERLRREATAVVHLASLSEQQRVLGAAALRGLSLATGDGLRVDSLQWDMGPGGLLLRVVGTAGGGNASTARFRLDTFLRNLRETPAFRSAEVVDQEIREVGEGRFEVNFAVRASLLGERGTG